MTILLPASAEELAPHELTPRQIVTQLDRYVVAQAAAKKALAIALRNRVRRQKLPPDVAVEITPKNILLIGPTGVGKTELARRVAGLSSSPFVKVEASKFTEVGYVGRDVETIIRDLTETAVHMVRSERRSAVQTSAEQATEERLLDLLLPPRRSPATASPEGHETDDEAGRRLREQFHATREKLRTQLRAGQLDQRIVEIEIRERGTPAFQVVSAQGVEEMDVHVKDLLPGLFGGGKKRRRLPLSDARRILQQEEEEHLIDGEQVAQEAVQRAEAAGIVFIDEIDKIAGREAGHGPEVSREGVQRDLLPILEGTTVTTKHGPVRTDHMLFIAAGAFHVAKPSDLIPELQGRFPIRVELQSLGLEDLIRILTEPQGALVSQYRALLATEGVVLTFGEDAVREIARYAMEVNDATENIGARRLATILECVLEQISFDAPDVAPKTVHITAEDVRLRVAPLARDTSLSRFVL